VDSGALPTVASGTSVEETYVVMVNQRFIRPALKANAKSATEAIEALSEPEVLALKAKIDAEGEAEVAGFQILSAWLTFKAKGAQEGKVSPVDSKDITLKLAKAQSDIGTTIKVCDDSAAQTKESVAVDAPSIIFPNCGAVEGVKSKKKPVIELKNLSFQYGIDEPFFLSGISGKLCVDSRVAICGSSTSGKSTLLKMICSELKPMPDKGGQTGEVVRNSNLRLAFMTQGHPKTLDACLTPLDYISKRFQHGYDEELQLRLMQTGGMEEADSKSISAEAAGSIKRPVTSREIRKHVKTFGIDEEMCSSQIGSLSASQKVCISLAALFWTKPHFVVVDEFAKGLDTETTAALLLAFQSFKGGMLLVEPEGDFAEKVCTETWTLADGLVTVAQTATGLK